ncbi:hypothetical protein [Paenibacillus sp. FSL K6-0108]|uniref:hypothetical protein n=1 Tax=Paenibacillus sp. FSL K6-0108 TaxID=2921417 RepID=UPI003246491E
MDDIKVSLLVANEILFNNAIKRHSINDVLNLVEVPYIPCAVKTHVLVKILFPKRDFQEEGYMDIVAPDGLMELNTPIMKIMNFRPHPANPGMDASLQINFAVVEEGTYKYRFYVRHQLVAEYPLQVLLKK